MLWGGGRPSLQSQNDSIDKSTSLQMGPLRELSKSTKQTDFMN